MIKKIIFLIYLTFFFLVSQELIAPSQLKRGMVLDGITRMDGNKMVSFKLIILSVLKNSSPGEDSIMAEITTDIFKETGVLAGMSGSPVYYQEKLVGAVAYTSSFMKKPIVGITPIHTMLKLLKYDKIKRKDYYKDSAALYGLKKISTPLMYSGGLFINKKILDSYLTNWFDSDYLLIPGGEGSSNTKTERFIPGDACGLNLVRGDLNISALGTVTYVSNDVILAFGHPMFQAGNVEIPLYQAKVEASIPLLSLSYKLGIITKEVGVITEDSSTAILGRLGKFAKMIPIEVELNTPIQKKKFNYEVIADSQFFNNYAMLVIINSFFHYESLTEESRVSYQIDIETDYKDKIIKLMDVVSLENNTSSIKNLQNSLGSIISYLQYNRFLPIKIKRISVKLNLENYIDFSYIDDVVYKKREYHPGETVPIKVKINKYKAKPFITNVSITLPSNLEDGIYPIMISSGYLYLSYDMYFSPLKYTPESPDKLFDLINTEINSRTLMVWMYSPSEGVIVDGNPYRNLPVCQKDFILSAGNVKTTPLYEYHYQKYDMPQVVMGGQLIQIVIRNALFNSDSKE